MTRAFSFSNPETGVIIDAQLRKIASVKLGGLFDPYGALDKRAAYQGVKQLKTGRPNMHALRALQSAVTDYDSLEKTNGALVAPAVAACMAFALDHAPAEEERLTVLQRANYMVQGAWVTNATRAAAIMPIVGQFSMLACDTAQPQSLRLMALKSLRELAGSVEVFAAAGETVIIEAVRACGACLSDVTLDRAGRREACEGLGIIAEETTSRPFFSNAAAQMSVAILSGFLSKAGQPETIRERAIDTLALIARNETILTATDGTLVLPILDILDSVDTPEESTSGLVARQDKKEILSDGAVIPYLSAWWLLRSNALDACNFDPERKKDMVLAQWVTRHRENKDELVTVQKALDAQVRKTVLSPALTQYAAAAMTMTMTSHMAAQAAPIQNELLRLLTFKDIVDRAVNAVPASGSAPSAPAPAQG